MKKFLNSVETALTESLDGFAAAHADILVLGDERKFVRRKALKPGKVALVSGGGSGHEPLAWRLGWPWACSTPPARARSSPRRRPTR